jgi:hypothetical protein
MNHPPCRVKLPRPFPYGSLGLSLDRFTPLRFVTLRLLPGRACKAR